MKHYINANSEIFAFESDGSQDHLIKSNMQPITQAEITERNKPTVEQQKKQLTQAIQNHLDTTAQERGYDGILSLASYATDPDPTFQAEGQAGVEWRGKVWTYGYQALADVEAGTRAIPTADELVSELPAFVWPANVT